MCLRQQQQIVDRFHAGTCMLRTSTEMRMGLLCRTLGNVRRSSSVESSTLQHQPQQAGASCLPAVCWYIGRIARLRLWPAVYWRLLLRPGTPRLLLGQRLRVCCSIGALGRPGPGALDTGQLDTLAALCLEHASEVVPSAQQVVHEDQKEHEHRSSHQRNHANAAKARIAGRVGSDVAANQKQLARCGGVKHGLCRARRDSRSNEYGFARTQRL